MFVANGQQRTNRLAPVRAKLTSRLAPVRAKLTNRLAPVRAKLTNRLAPVRARLTPLKNRVRLIGSHRLVAPMGSTLRRLWARRPRPSNMQLWAGSSTTLGVAEVTYLAKETPLVRAIQGLGFWGGVGLTYAASKDWRRAKGISEKADAFGDLAWGIEGMMEFSPLFSKQLGFFAPIVGTLGGICQTGVGLRRMWRGFRGKDWNTFKLGMWDLASGGFWLAWDLFGIENPITVGGFVGTMIGREIYANRKQIKQSVKRAGKAIKRKNRRTRARLRLMKRKARHWRQDTLRYLGQRLRQTSKDSPGRF